MHGNRKIQVLRGGPETVVSWVVQTPAVVWRRTNRRAAESQFGDMLEFAQREIDVLKRDRADGAEAALVSLAEICDPAVVALACRRGHLMVADARVKQPDGWIEDGCGEALSVEDFEARIRLLGSGGNILPPVVQRFFEVAEAVRHRSGGDRKFVEDAALDLEVRDAVAFDHLRSEIAVLGR